MYTLTAFSVEGAGPHVRCVSRVCSRISASLFGTQASWVSRLPWELGFVRGKRLLWNPWASASCRNTSSLSAFHMDQGREDGSFDDFRSFMLAEHTDQSRYGWSKSVAMCYIFLGPQ